MERGQEKQDPPRGDDGQGATVTAKISIAGHHHIQYPGLEAVGQHAGLYRSPDPSRG